MEAIFRDGGKQYKVSEGATIEVELKELEPGSTLEFPDVLFVGEEGKPPRVGTPVLEGAKVVGTVLGEIRGPKVLIANFLRRKNSRRRIGHRQPYTRVKIERIQA
jgi:large subunit ribosomal protein L21